MQGAGINWISESKEKQVKLDVPVIGILRGVEAGFFGEVMRASFAAGLQAVEVTMNTAQAERMVAENRPVVPPGKLLGMGTIRNRDEARRAVDAGAMFLVTPNLDLEVIEYARSANLPIVVGALTPSEVCRAWSNGATAVKVFPCRAMGGADYIRELRGPFDHIPLVAVGGVTIDNLKDYFAAGTDAVGVGSSLFGGDALKSRNIEALAGNVRRFISHCVSGENAG